MAEEVKISRKLTVKDTGITLDENNKISTTSNPIPARNAKPSNLIQQDVISYKLGINNLKFQYNNANNVSGINSEIINIVQCDYVTLFSSLNNQNKSDLFSTEFYIVDNGKEKPILPYNQNNILYEKLFYGLPLRFEVSKTDKITVQEISSSDITVFNVYNNIKEFNNARNQIDEQIKNNNKLLVVSYVPESGKRIKIDNSLIYVKIIKRIYVGNLPVQVNNIIVNAHGGKLEWKI
jgi:hypothetical protein|nr:MAG TPA: hypothetical protein [Caudoviricetes sp.]